MRFSGFAARTKTAFTAGFASIAVLLSAPTVAVANPAQTELDALKAAAATGDVVSTVRLVQELLMSLPAQAGTSEPQPALFAHAAGGIVSIVSERWRGDFRSDRPYVTPFSAEADLQPARPHQHVRDEPG